MCGIAGSVNLKYNSRAIKNVMGHRGPDDQTEYSIDNVKLNHLRLSIQDIRFGHQPRHYMNRYTIVFNGEIYNHKELRKKFDLRCETNSDTETILHLYHKIGDECLKEFDGMFALAIFDKEQKKLFLARDRAGKKPLYYYLKDNIFFFASELNTIRICLPLSINEEHISSYFRLGFMYRSLTPYYDVQELENGHWLTVNSENLSVNKKQWWDVSRYYGKNNEQNLHETLTIVDNYLHQGIKRRIDASDLEVGAFLSGGIDSGLVTSIASQYSPSIRTFTVSFPGVYDEAPLAKLVSEKHQTAHTEINISFNDLSKDIEKILSNYGEPFYDSSAIPSYYVSKAAKEHITVILNGDGADELFGGYRRYVPFRYFDFFTLDDFYKKKFKALYTLLPKSNNKQNRFNYFSRLIDLAGKTGFEVYLSSTSNIFEGFEEQFLKNTMLEKIKADFEKKMAIASSFSALDKMMYLDFEITLFSDLLVKMDIATMANSQEGRSPFLCKELLEYAPTIKDQYKIKGLQTKFLLRKLAEKYLPTSLVNQPKRGFEIPLKNWVDNELKEIIFDQLTSNSYASNYLNARFIEQLKTNNVAVSQEVRAKMLWTLFSLEVWHKNQINLYSV